MKVKYTCIYADADGDSHFKDEEVECNEANFAPPASPLNVSEFGPAVQYGFIIAPIGWYGDWHSAPHRQFMLRLAGQIESRVSDGEVRTFGPGDILLLEDTTGKGHISRVIGSTEVIDAVVTLPD